MKDALHRAFISPYRGQAVDAFCEYLENNNNKFAREYDRAKYYGIFCSIVKSSGTGKSRLLLELRTKGVVVLYMNLPPSADKTDFPPRDVLPAEILTANLGSKADYSARCCAFFAAVFTMINEYLSALTASRGLGDAIKQWNDSMCSLLSKDRNQSFTRLKTEYDAYYEVWDHMADPLKGIAATDVAQAGHIIGYGRLLWKSIQRGSVREMVELAINTLLGPEQSKNVALATLSWVTMKPSNSLDQQWLVASISASRSATSVTGVSPLTPPNRSSHVRQHIQCTWNVFWTCFCGHSSTKLVLA
ncbi:hypothetical protein EDC04DRAFT_1628899 [Pisolithus marmoratus]|nr:hypothetical protein EDC04DRAFT_1628899 [Pisolithus marmoratus]